jgi:hypothetical protein
MQTPTLNPLFRRAARAVALLAALLIFTPSQEAHADLVTGLNAAFTVDAFIGAGSVVSLVGNAVDLARSRPQRGWIYSGFILGTANLAAGLITIFFGGDPIEYQGTNMCYDQASMTTNPCGPNTPQIQYGLGIAQTVLGAVNLGLAIRNSVIWHRHRVAEIEQKAPAAPAPSPLAHLQVAPLVSRGVAGLPVYGVTVNLAGF